MMLARDLVIWLNFNFVRVKIILLLLVLMITMSKAKKTITTTKSKQMEKLKKVKKSKRVHWQLKLIFISQQKFMFLEVKLVVIVGVTIDLVAHALVKHQAKFDQVVGFVYSEMILKECGFSYYRFYIHCDGALFALMMPFVKRCHPTKKDCSKYK